MLRRKLTRVEVKLEDLKEFAQIKKENENLAGVSKSSSSGAALSQLAKREMIHERIGYNPQPVVSPRTPDNLQTGSPSL